jgi:hypothetical protein
VCADSEQKQRALIAATVIVMVLIFVVGVLSTGVVSTLCGFDSKEGTYCARISEGKFPIEELCLILAPVVLAAWPGVLSVRRRSARPLLVASLPLFLITVLLPLVVGVAWK